MAQTIGTSSFTEEWLISTLKEVDPSEFVAISKVESVKEISGGKGFCSKVYLCNLGSVSVILKVPEIGKLELDDSLTAKDAPLPSICEIHDREARFYDDFASLSLISLPKIYKTGYFGADGKNQAFLLMEDLTGKGELGSLVDGFNKWQLLSMARDFAKFQAYFIKNQDGAWFGRFHKQIADTTIPIMSGFFEKLKAIDPNQFGKTVDRLLPFVKDWKFYNWISFDAFKTFDLPAVISHGNLWTNNIFLSLNPDGSCGNQITAYIDWQLANTGCMTTDLAEVLVLCTEADIRRQFTDEILMEFYKTLEKELGKVEFSFEQVKQLYNATYFNQCFNLMVAVAYHPVMVAHLPEKVQQPQIEKLIARCKFALEDCLALIDSLPSQFDELKTK